MAPDPATRLIVGYFLSSGIHARNYHVADIPAEKLTHIIYAFAGVSAQGQCVSTDPQDDQISLPSLQALRQQRPALKVLLSIGGAFNSSNFPVAAKTVNSRQTFAQSCVGFMKVSGLDGIDVDWEFPGSADKAHFTALLKELRTQLDTQGTTDGKRYLLTAALPASLDQYTNFDLAQIHQYLDWINLMAYNFYTGSSSTTELASPLYASSTDPAPKRTSRNVDAAVKAYLAASVPAAKLVIGMPFFGVGWRQVAPVNDGLYQQTAGAAHGTWSDDGEFDFRDLRNNYIGNYSRFWSNESMAPWLYSADAQIMITYDDEQSLGIKADYINTNGLAGAMIWPLSGDDAQSALTTTLSTRLNQSSGPGSNQRDMSQYASVLPYDAEIFGVYRPLLAWYGNQASNRMNTLQARSAAAIIASMAQDQKLIGSEVAVQDPLANARLMLADPLQSEVGGRTADVVSAFVNRTGQPPTTDEWRQLLSLDALGQTLSQALASSTAKAGSQFPALQGIAFPSGAASSSSPPAVGQATEQSGARTEIATANFLAWASGHAPTLLNTLFLTSRPTWRTAINFIDPLDNMPAAGSGQLPSAVLSPVGLINLFREYFYEFDTFLGPPVGHVWVSPGGSLELIEVSTRKATVELTTEQSTTQVAKSEQDTTQQDELSDAVKSDNKNDTKLGASVNAGGSFLGIVHADASASFSSDSVRQTSSEQAHKQSRTQSEKLSKEITQNFKTTFRTVTETTDTTSRRYVLQNTTDQLVNFELRRKMRLIGVQLQHIGTRLSWQAFVPGPGSGILSPAGLLGKGEFVIAPADNSAAAAIQAPAPLAPLAPKQTEMTAYFPFYPFNGEPSIASNSDDFWVSDPPPEMHKDDNTRHIWGSQTFIATPPDTGYTLSGITLKQASNPGGADVRCVPSFSFTPGSETFTMQLQFVNFGAHNAISLDLVLTWDPPQNDPRLPAYQQAYQAYQDALNAAQQQSFVNATRALVKVISGIKPRSTDDLRNEERHVVFRQLYQQLTQLPLDTSGHITAEYIRELFDVDQMLYYVEPDYFLPQPVAHMPLLGGSPRTSDPLSDATIADWPRPTSGDWRDYLITEDSQPAPMGASLGWMIQLDGDERRNEFLNAAWIKAVLPVRPGRELDALAWLQQQNVEGESGLDNPYIPQLGDPPGYVGSIRQVLNMMASDLQKQNLDIQNTLGTETVFEKGFDPLADGIQLDPRTDFKGNEAKPYKNFDFWLEVLPTDQVAAVAVAYDPKTGREL